VHGAECDAYLRRFKKGGRVIVDHLLDTRTTTDQREKRVVPRALVKRFAVPIP
jgi:hypothetical protein